MLFSQRLIKRLNWKSNVEQKVWDVPPLLDSRKSYEPERDRWRPQYKWVPCKELKPGTDGRIEPYLVLLVLEKSFQGDDNHFDHLLHCVTRWVQVPDGLRLRKERVDFGWSLRHVLSFSLLLHLGMWKITFRPEESRSGSTNMKPESTFKFILIFGLAEECKSGVVTWIDVLFKKIYQLLQSWCAYVQLPVGNVFQ